MKRVISSLYPYVFPLYPWFLIHFQVYERVLPVEQFKISHYPILSNRWLIGFPTMASNPQESLHAQFFARYVLHGSITTFTMAQFYIDDIIHYYKSLYNTIYIYTYVTYVYIYMIIHVYVYVYIYTHDYTCVYIYIYNHHYDDFLMKSTMAHLLFPFRKGLHPAAAARNPPQTPRLAHGKGHRLRGVEARVFQLLQICRVDSRLLAVERTRWRVRNALRRNNAVRCVCRTQELFR